MCRPCATVRDANSRIQFHPDGGQSDFVRLPARTPHGGASYVWCLAARRNQEKYPPGKHYRPLPCVGVIPQGTYGSRFRARGPDRTLYTIVNRVKRGHVAGVDGGVLRAECRQGDRFFDLYHGHQLTAGKKKR